MAVLEFLRGLAKPPHGALSGSMDIQFSNALAAATAVDECTDLLATLTHETVGGAVSLPRGPMAQVVG